MVSRFPRLSVREIYRSLGGSTPSRKYISEINSKIYRAILYDLKNKQRQKRHSVLYGVQKDSRPYVLSYLENIDHNHG